MHEGRKLHDLLVRDIDAEIEQESEGLVDGSASDFADYKRRVGRIRGLKEARDIASDCLSRLTKDDDEDE